VTHLSNKKKETKRERFFMVYVPKEKKKKQNTSMTPFVVLHEGKEGTFSLYNELAGATLEQHSIHRCDLT
jgi:hypothetical protein